MCSPDVIDLIPYDSHDSKVKDEIMKLKETLEKRRDTIQAALDEIKRRFGI